MYDLVDLRAQVPMYHQEDTQHGCGPTNIQMARNGYPEATDDLLFTQVEITNKVRPNNTKEGWDTDPQGLYETINQLQNPRYVNWDQVYGKEPSAVLLKIITAMDQARYPAPTLVNGGDHWILMVKFVTDVQPTPGATVTLQEIGVYDSLDSGEAIYHHLDPSEWFGTYWKKANAHPKPPAYGRWRKCYVGVVQTLPHPAAASRGAKLVAKPAGKAKPGRLIIPRPARANRSGPITPSQARDLALRWFRGSGYPHEAAYHGLAEAPAGEPMLVRSLPGGKTSYFIVPINESARPESGTSVAVLIDAATGAFKQAAMFAKPVRYLGRAGAVAVVRSALDGRGGEDKAEAELVHRPCTISRNRVWPFWRVRTNGKIYYVTQRGELFLKLEEQTKGGN